jgi:hypothetical protein
MSPAAVPVWASVATETAGREAEAQHLDRPVGVIDVGGLEVAVGDALIVRARGLGDPRHTSMASSTGRVRAAIGDVSSTY